MRTGRPIPELTLNEDEREVLGQWVRRRSSAQPVARQFTLSALRQQCSRRPKNSGEGGVKKTLVVANDEPGSPGL